jgi:hypothetical protein
VPTAALRCRALQRPEARFDVVYALPLLAITLLHHREALSAEHGEAAWVRAYAAAQVERLFAYLMAPAMAAFVSAVGAALAEVARFRAEQERVEAAAEKLQQGQLPKLEQLQQGRSAAGSRRPPLARAPLVCLGPCKAVERRAAHSARPSAGSSGGASWTRHRSSAWSSTSAARAPWACSSRPS